MLIFQPTKEATLDIQMFLVQPFFLNMIKQQVGGNWQTICVGLSRIKNDCYYISI